MRLRSCLPVLVLAGLSLACTSWERRHQLERVAKDWCLTIRASQVIPVYPLTEDLQPGDVFLVQTPVEEQVEVYEDRGFLPLEQMLVRLQPEEYPDFPPHLLVRDKRRYWKGGVWGNPGRASAEKGEALMDIAVRHLAEIVAHVEGGETPPAPTRG